MPINIKNFFFKKNLRIMGTFPKGKLKRGQVLLFAIYKKGIVPSFSIIAVKG